MIQVRRLGHAGFETPDLEGAIAYYTQLAGLVVAARDKNRAYLATTTGQLAIELELGPAARCTKLTFAVAPNEDFGAMIRVLENLAISSERRSDTAPGLLSVLAFYDPKGTAIQLFPNWNFFETGGRASGVRPLKLGHVAFVVPDPRTVAEFYQTVLGFRVSDWIEDFFVFLRCDSDHHAVNFVAGRNTGLHHMAFELKDVAHLQSACEVLAQQKTPIIWGPVRLGPGHNVAIFHRNADGQVVEFFTELDQMSDEALGYFEPRPWHRDRPQRPKVWKGGDNITWGLPPTADFIRDRD